MSKLHLSDLWRMEGTLDRGPYALWGVILFAIKYNLDRIIAAAAFGRVWSLFQYFAPQGSGRVDSLHGRDLRFYGVLLLCAVPFIYSGVALTLRRLRSAQLPSALVGMFFIPAVNLLFFATLAVLPAAAGPDAEAEPRDERPVGRLGRALGRIVPRGRTASAAMALFMVLPVAVLLTMVSVRVMHNYGWGVFVGLPFGAGLAAALLYGYHEPRPLGGCLSVALLSVTLLGGCLLLVAVEGVFCLIMAFPIGAILGLLGGTVGYLIQRPFRNAPPASPAVLLLLCALLPAMLGAERAEDCGPDLIPVRTAIEVAAPPEVVWQHVVSVSELPEPASFIFRYGIAYPQRAEIQGSGVGAVRRCVFSTGAFVEPIEVWDAPRLLRFSVRSQPPAMKELTPWGHINAPHISNFLVSEGGQFLLTPLPGNRTRLEGTTWYRHRIWPADYWRIWSDWILHSIHQRVLEHVKQTSEQAFAKVA